MFIDCFNNTWVISDILFTSDCTDDRLCTNTGKDVKGSCNKMSEEESAVKNSQTLCLNSRCLGEASNTRSLKCEA